MQQLLPLVQSKAWPFTGIISHRMPLQQGVEAYKMFAEVGPVVLVGFQAYHHQVSCIAMHADRQAVALLGCG
jgi:hypothetical protein